VGTSFALGSEIKTPRAQTPPRPKTDPGLESGFPDQSGLRYLPDRSCNVLHSSFVGANLFAKYRNKKRSCRRDRATHHVIKYFAKSLKVTEGHSK